MSNSRLLFVYGSLRSGFHHPAYSYIRDHFDFISEGKVKGLLYDMGEYPAAIPTNDERFIIGELYNLKETAEWDWSIAQLDGYEGLMPEEGETALYKRETTQVILPDGNKLEAWLYWFNGNVAGRPEISSGDVLAYRNEKG